MYVSTHMVDHMCGCIHCLIPRRGLEWSKDMWKKKVSLFNTYQSYLCLLQKQNSTERASITVNWFRNLCKVTWGRLAGLIYIGKDMLLFVEERAVKWETQKSLSAGFKVGGGLSERWSNWQLSSNDGSFGETDG